MYGVQSGPRSPPSSQYQCPFFTRLPAEIRNKIYAHVFTRNTSVFTNRRKPKPPHQLSLLLTCKRVHAEAHVLAFETYAFPLPSTTNAYVRLRDRVSHVSAQHMMCITVLTALGTSNTAASLTYALILFPSLRTFIVQEGVMHLAGATPGCCRRNQVPSGFAYPMGVLDGITQRPEDRAVARYATRVLTSLVHAVSSGYAHKWQQGEKWSVEWPQLESSYMYTQVQIEFNEMDEDLVMDTEALSAVNGVDVCACGCGDVSWTGAELVQEGGRRVRVCVAYCTREEQHACDESLSAYYEVQLLPGTTPASDVVAERAGISYEPDEAYWEGLRRRNGNLGALCRALWNRAMVFENESYSRLTNQRR